MMLGETLEGGGKITGQICPFQFYWYWWFWGSISNACNL